MTIPVTTTTELRTQITAAIAAATPRVQHQGAGKWVPMDRTPSSTVGTRKFSVALSPIGQTQGGLIGLGLYDTTALLQVVTSYAVPEQQMEILEDDALHIREIVLTLRGSSGLITCVYNGTQVNEQENSDAVMVSHQYEIRYMRSTEVN